MNRKKRKLEFIDGFVIGGLVSAIIMLVFVTVSQDRHLLSSKDITRLNSLTDMVEKYYYEDIDKQEIKDSIYAGVFNNLDAYSMYYSKESYSDFTESISKEFAGIGISYSLDLYVESFRIISVYFDSPAYKAGIKASDILLEVDGTKINGMKLEEVSDLLKGDYGTSVTLKILRGEEILDFTMERDYIKTKYSHAVQINNETGYISITNFLGDSAIDFAESLEKVKDSKNLIIDLRDNPGGDIAVLTDILKQIVPDDLIATLIYKSGKKEEFYITEGTDKKYNFAILVNENSASCSEIMSAFFQEKGYGTIIGKTTYGKGVVQGLMPLSHGDAVRITIGRYVTPNGNDLGNVGVTPDILTTTKYSSVETVEEALNDQDIQVALDIFK